MIKKSPARLPITVERGLLLLPATIGKYLGHLFQKPLTPLPDLIGMNAILARKLGHRLLSFQGFQGNPGLECRIVALSNLPVHRTTPFKRWQANMHLIALSSFWGGLYFSILWMARFRSIELKREMSARERRDISLKPIFPPGWLKLENTWHESEKMSSNN